MIHHFQNISLDTDAYQLKRDHRPVAIEPQVFDLLVYLIENHDRVVTRDELLANLWKGKVVSDAALSGRLKALRKAVGDTGKHQNIIKTIHGRGYQFVASLNDEPILVEEPKKSTTDLPLPEMPSIAVVPFKALSSDPEDEHFSRGITEEIVGALTQFHTLFVISSHSTEVYRDSNIDPKLVAKEQGVRYVLEGSVRKNGDRIRVTTQLTDTSTGKHRWAERYERKLDDIFEVQDDIMFNIVSALQVQLARGNDAKLDKTTNKVEAWLLVARGNSLLNILNKEANLEARALAKQAMEIDPNYPLAWNLMGWCYVDDAHFEWTDDRETLCELALDAAERGKALGDNSPYYYALVSYVNLMRGEYDRAREQALEILKVGPNSAEGLAMCAYTLAFVGDVGNARQQAKRSLRLCPNYPPYFSAILAFCYLMSGEPGRAAKVLKDAIQRDNSAGIVRVPYIVALMETDQHEEAKRVALQLLDIEPTMSANRWFGKQIKNRDVHNRWVQHLITAGVAE